MTFKARAFSVLGSLNRMIEIRTLCIAEFTHCVTRCATRTRPSAQRRANCLMWCDIGGCGVAAASGPEVRLRDGDTLWNAHPVFYPQVELRLRKCEIIFKLTTRRSLHENRFRSEVNVRPDSLSNSNVGINDQENPICLPWKFLIWRWWNVI